VIVMIIGMMIIMLSYDSRHTLYLENS